MGSMKLSGEEITKEKFTGNVTDWSIGHWTNTVDPVDREASTSTK